MDGSLELPLALAAPDVQESFCHHGGSSNQTHPAERVADSTSQYLLYIEDD